MMRDVERYWKAGFALGASLENTVAVGDGGVVGKVVGGIAQQLLGLRQDAPARAPELRAHSPQLARATPNTTAP